MLSQEQNDLITRVGPGTAAGGLMRRYWQPVALVDELSGANRPIKPVKLMGENLVLFRDEAGRYGLMDESEAKSYIPTVVHVDADNRIVELGGDPSAPVPGATDQMRSDLGVPVR